MNTRFGWTRSQKLRAAKFTSAVRRPRKRRTRQAFTLVELLVVIAIIGILVALLLPAIQAAREAARKTQCSNNIRNLAVGCLNYHDSHKKFPPGFEFGNFGVPTWGWPYHIFAFIEEGALRDSLATGVNNSDRTLAQVFTDGTANGGLNSREAQLLQTPLSVFRCPSDPTPELLPASEDGTNSSIMRLRPFDSTSPKPPGGGSPPFQPATSNYVGNLGFFYARLCLAGGLPPSIPPKFGCDNNGIFYIGSEVKIEQITDGTTHTIMLGERDERANSATWIGTPSPPDINHNRGYHLVATCRWGVSQPDIPRIPANPTFRAADASFSSTHAGGANFAMCDGSVRFISDEIDWDNDGCRHGITGGGDGEHRPSPNEYWPAEWPDCDTNSLGVFHRLGSRDDGLVIDESF